MNKKAQMGMFTTVMVALVVGVIGLVVVQGIASPMYENQGVTGETGSFTNASYSDLEQDGLVTDSETVYNSTDCSTTVDSADYTMNYSDGGIIMSDSSYDGWDQCIDYSYQADNYIDDSTTRTVLLNIPILFAIGLLIGAVAWYKGF